MVKKIVLIMVVMLVLPMVLAVDLEINVKTLPNYNVFVNVAEPIDDDKWHPVEEGSPVKIVADGDGIGSGTFSSDRFNEVKIKITVNNADGKYLFEDLGLRSMNEPLYLQLIKGAVSHDYREFELEEEENETIEEKENVTEEIVPIEEETVEETTEEGTEEPGITGSAISADGSWLFSRTTMWIVGIAIVVAIVVVFVVRRSLSGPKIDLPKVHNINSLPEMPKAKASTPIDDELSKTEEEIENVRSRIARIKKVKESEKKLQAEQEELRRLESGE